MKPSNKRMDKLYVVLAKPVITKVQKVTSNARHVHREHMLVILECNVVNHVKLEIFNQRKVDQVASLVQQVDIRIKQDNPLASNAMLDNTKMKPARQHANIVNQGRFRTRRGDRNVQIVR